MQDQNCLEHTPPAEDLQEEKAELFQLIERLLASAQYQLWLVEGLRDRRVTIGNAISQADNLYISSIDRLAAISAICTKLLGPVRVDAIPKCEIFGRYIRCAECGINFQPSEDEILPFGATCSDIGKTCRDRRDDSVSERIRLRRMPYREYLRTDHWRELRRIKLQQSGEKCELCGCTWEQLNVHHKTYDNRGNEDLTDLIVLCHPCHSKFHDKLPGGAA